MRSRWCAAISGGSLRASPYSTKPVRAPTPQRPSSGAARHSVRLPCVRGHGVWNAVRLLLSDEMDQLDRTLESIVRSWVASNAANRATVRIEPANGGGPPSIEVVPHNPAAITITLWVADDGEHVAFRIGGGS